MKRKLLLTLAILQLGLSSCSVSRYDLPTKDGVPTISTIVRRLTCELVALVAEDANPPYRHRDILLRQDYQVAVSLTLDVTDTGELAPSFNFPLGPDQNLTRASANAAFVFNKARQQTFTQNFQFSLRDLAERRRKNSEFGRCPPKNTNLAGNLGIEQNVSLALPQPFSQSKQASPAGEFGGAVAFTVTRKVQQVGVTWTIERFAGPGYFGSLSNVNTHKIVYAFAVNPKPTKAAPLALGGTDRAQKLLDRILLDQVGRRLQ